jgi:magnesium-transporting ATPase (P-type)
MKNAIATWRWTLGVVARSPAVLVVLAAVAALWGLGAYQWLWLPESSGLLLLLALVWAAAQIAVAAAFFAATTTASAGAATSEGGRLELQSLLGFGRRRFWRTLAWGAASLVFILILFFLFRRSDDLALEVASFFTFHSEKAVSPISVGKVFWVIQMLIWVIVGSFLLSFLTRLLRDGWRETGRRAGRILASCCWRAPFWTLLLDAAVFGGLAWLLATWRPKVPAGFWDYAQVLVRMSASLLLIVSGWLFAVLALARLNLPHDDPPAS